MESSQLKIAFTMPVIVSPYIILNASASTPLFLFFFVFLILRYFPPFNFRDMAEIVDQQGVMVEEIVVSTEKSHERAQAGLTQVQKAAASQQSCTLS